MALYVARRYGEAIVELAPRVIWSAWVTMYRAACYFELGCSEEARAEVVKFIDKRPGLSPVDYARNEPFKNPADHDRLVEGVRRAGLLE
jgi:adenylate cyclase